ncbi:SpoIIE family protein phosphatase [Thiohalocapsa marina]|uniref:SpoIIE family protein phosphatase n=1 Tax=Thiohalocapsa marina TaxID=424902 RepID=A0A5M8FNH6_9GAMM|nr:protein phosphatase 2C domain-containing protein [Thiohalocapsa marina]KAA6182482.1 SpoIIE family protein phosphatase [Thiohalocapsa marina]
MNLSPGNAQWIGQRSEQQDAFGFVGFEQAYFRSHAGVLAVVADGMGGLYNGHEASRRALQVMLDAYRDKRPDESIPDALVRCLAGANSAVHALAQDSDGEGNVGTTLVAAAVRDGQLFWVSAGDSRLYLYRQADGSLTQCTQDHSYGNELMPRVSSGEMTREEVERHPDRDALTSFLGLSEVPKVDRNLRPVQIDQGDRLLLCSDGVYGVLSEDELKGALRLGAQAAADALVALIQQKRLPRQDNATVAILAVQGDSASPKSVEPETRRLHPGKPRRRRRPVLVLLGLLLLVMLVVLAVLWFRGDLPLPWRGAADVSHDAVHASERTPAASVGPTPDARDRDALPVSDDPKTPAPFAGSAASSPQAKEPATLPPEARSEPEPEAQARSAENDAGDRDPVAEPQREGSLQSAGSAAEAPGSESPRE